MSVTHVPRPSTRAMFAVAMAAGLATAGAAADAAILTGPVTNPANGHSYFLLTTNTWSASEAEAVTLGGHLATVNDAAENTWIYNTFSKFENVNRNLWIGLYDLDPTVNSTNRATRRLEFGWVSGEPVTYSAWGVQEPNNPLTGGDPLTSPEFYVHIWNPTDLLAGRWNNYQDGTTVFSVGIYGVVEVVPEPGMLGLALAGVPLLLRRRGV